MIDNLKSTEAGTTATVSEPDGSGKFLVIDDKKLGRKGNQMLGGINALRMQAAKFTSIAQASEIAQERLFLKEIVSALLEEAAMAETELARYALERGAAKLHDTPHDAAKQ